MGESREYTGEVAQQLKYLPCMQEDPCKYQMALFKFWPWRWAPWSTLTSETILSASSGLVETFSLKEQGWKNDQRGFPMSILGFHIHAHIYVHTQTTYHVYTCKEENRRSFLSFLKLLLLLSEAGSHCAALVGLKLCRPDWG